MSLEVRRVEAGDPRWDPFVGEQEGATFCHLDGWAEIFSEAFGHSSYRLAAEDEHGEWRGVLPLTRVKSRLFGDYLLSVPFLNYGGPVGEPEARALLSHEAVAMAQDMGVDLLELRNRQETVSELDVSHRKVTVLLPLPDDSETLWTDGLKSKVRSQVRRPMKEDMYAEFGIDRLDAFYDVFCRNMRDLGTPVLPRSFFEAIGRVLNDEFVVCAIYHEDQPVAAGCGFLYRGEFELTWASSLREFNRQAPNMLLYWSLMEEMIERGAHTFNFGRCTPGSGTHKFKLQWGGEDEQLHWAQWAPGGVTATPSPDQESYGLAIKLWQRLPVPVASFLGPFISKSLP